MLCRQYVYLNGTFGLELSTSLLDITMVVKRPIAGFKTTAEVKCVTNDDYLQGNESFSIDIDVGSGKNFTNDTLFDQ